MNIAPISYQNNLNFGEGKKRVVQTTAQTIAPDGMALLIEEIKKNPQFADALSNVVLRIMMISGRHFSSGWDRTRTLSQSYLQYHTGYDYGDPTKSEANEAICCNSFVHYINSDASKNSLKSKLASDSKLQETLETLKSISANNPDLKAAVDTLLKDIPTGILELTK